jgi:hypothetical protein
LDTAERCLVFSFGGPPVDDFFLLGKTRRQDFREGDMVAFLPVRLLGPGWVGVNSEAATFDIGATAALFAFDWLVDGWMD